MLLIRLVGLAFAAIQITLALRLLLPFVEVPRALRQYVPGLVAVTDALVAPFTEIAEPFDLTAAAADLGGRAGLALGDYAQQVDPAVVVAMVGYALVSAFVLFVLRLVFRPAG